MPATLAAAREHAAHRLGNPTPPSSGVALPANLPLAGKLVLSLLDIRPLRGSPAGRASA